MKKKITIILLISFTFFVSFIYINEKCLKVYTYHNEESNGTLVLHSKNSIRRTLSFEQNSSLKQIQIFPCDNENIDYTIYIYDVDNKPIFEKEIKDYNDSSVKLDLIDCENLFIEIKNNSDKDLELKSYSDENINTFSIKTILVVPNNIRIMVILIMLILYCFSIFLYYYFSKQKIKVECLFLAFIIPLGFAYMLLFPPSTIPDEKAHIRHTLGYSSVILNKGTTDNIVIRESEIYSGLDKPSITSIDRYINNIQIFDTENKYIETNDAITPGIKMITYIPGIIGITLARILSLDGILTIYFGRIFTFLFYTMITFFAIKKIPLFKNVLLFCSLLPMTIHQVISLSYDATIFACSWLIIAYGLFCIYGNTKISKKDIIVFSLFSSLLSFQKGGFYILFNFLPILVGKKRLPDKKERIIFKSCTLIPFLTCLTLPMFFNTNLSKQVVSNQNIVNWSGTPAYTVSYFLNNIIETVKIFTKTILKNVDLYLFGMFGKYLGSLNIYLNNYIFYMWPIVGIYSSYNLDDEEKSLVYKLKNSDRIIYIVIFLAIFLLSMLAMAISFTPQGWPTIEGVQGRYFLPALPFLLIGLTIFGKNIIKNVNLDNKKYYFVFGILHFITLIDIIVACIQ